MDNTMAELDEWNRDFQKKLVDFVEYEEDLQTRYQGKFKEEFFKIENVLQASCKLLNNHLANAQTLVSRVPEAMVLIQNQDIIRQNIENLIKCLRIALEKKELLKEREDEEVLNCIVFIKKVLELSELLLDNIEEGLEGSIVALEQVLKEIDEQAAELEIETRYLGAFFAGTDEDSNVIFNLMQDVFVTVMGQVVDLLYIKQHIGKKSEFLLQGRDTFVGLMEKVEGEFEAINREIKTLKKMRVLIKIELSRITQNGNNSMQSIVAAVDEVVDTVYSNQAIFNRLRHYFVRNLDDFNKALECTRAKLQNSAGGLESSKNRLQRARTLIAGAIRAMTREMGDICQELKQPYAHIQVRQQVNEMISEIRRRIKEFDEFLSDRETELFAYFGVEQWEENEEDLKALLDQFTCYVERKSATSLFEKFDTGIDNHSSDIVLF